MSRLYLSAVAALCLSWAFATAANASLTFIPVNAGQSQAGNLVANGSFENGHPGGPGNTNERYWATGTIFTPFLVPPGWTSSGASSTYASWGSDDTGPSYEYRNSDITPDGQLSIYFGNGLANVSQQPQFNADGTVGWVGPAGTFTSLTGAPAILSQVVNTQLSPAPYYTLSFWASGEASGGGFNTEEGIFGFRMYNAEVGDPIHLLAVPAGAGPQGMSRYYRYDFVPLNTSLPVQIDFINWGHIDMSPYGGNATTELLIDDVVIQPAPEPSTLLLAGIGAAALAAWQLRRAGELRRSK